MYELMYSTATKCIRHRYNAIRTHTHTHTQYNYIQYSKSQSSLSRHITDDIFFKTKVKLKLQK